MTKDFFGKQVDRLRNVYSAASLSTERIEILWEFFRRYPNEQFEGGVSYLIGEFTTQQLPPVSKFQDAVARFQKNAVQRKAELSKYPPCAFCNRNGFVTTKTRGSPRYEVLFKCNCSAGEEFRARADTWDMAKHFDLYEPIEPIGEPFTGYSENPHARELAESYAPAIRKLLRNGAGLPLPYNSKERGEIPVFEEKTLKIEQAPALNGLSPQQIQLLFLDAQSKGDQNLVDQIKVMADKVGINLKTGVEK